MSENGNVVMLKAVVVLCCMISLISLLLGGLGVYFYLFATHNWSYRISKDSSILISDSDEKSCTCQAYYTVLSKIDHKNPTGESQYVVAMGFSSEPVLLVVPSGIYDLLEIGKTYEMRINYAASNETIDFLTSSYKIVSASFTEKTGLELQPRCVCE